MAFLGQNGPELVLMCQVRLRFCDQLLARERELKKATMMSDEKIFALVRPFSTLTDIPH